MAKVVVPKATRIFTHLWNPRQHFHNERGIQLAKQFLIFLEPGSDSMKELYAAIGVTFQGILERFPPIKPASADQNNQAILQNGLKVCLGIESFYLL